MFIYVILFTAVAFALVGLLLSAFVIAVICLYKWVSDMFKWIKTLLTRNLCKKNRRMIDIYDIRQVFSEMNEETKRLVLSQPEIDAQSVVHGHWVEYQVPPIICCSNCDWATGIEEKNFQYCPNCGAKMDGGSD